MFSTDGREWIGGDPLSTLQTAAVAVGLPFSFVLVSMAWGLMRQIRKEPEESKMRNTFIAIEQKTYYR